MLTHATSHQMRLPIALLACLLPALALPSCVGQAQRPGWAEPGVAVVGRITRVEEVQIWDRDLVRDGHLFWLRTRTGETLIFGSEGQCPAPNPSNDGVLVMLVRTRYGYQGAHIKQEDVSGLFAIACTRIDPKNSQFASWPPGL